MQFPPEMWSTVDVSQFFRSPSKGSVVLAQVASHVEMGTVYFISQKNIFLLLFLHTVVLTL